MTNLLEQAINCHDGDRAAKIIQDALGIESEDVANSWPSDREVRARIIGDWLQAEAKFLAQRREQRMLTPTQHRPLRQTLLAGIAVIGFALFGAVVLYFATEGILLLRADISGQAQQAFIRPQ